MNIIKNFTDFKQGITELTEIVPELLPFTGNLLEEEAVISNLLEVVKNDTPSIYNSNYPATSAFSIDAKEVGFKTAGYLAFGWKTLINGDNITYSFRLTIVEKNKFAKPLAIVDELVAKGWRVLLPAPQK